MEISEFYAARLDEDEAQLRESMDYLAPGCALPGLHLDPDRARREIEAGRRILADYGKALNFETGFNDGDQPRQVLEMVLRYRAAEFSDHPDYQESWKP